MPSFASKVYLSVSGWLKLAARLLSATTEAVGNALDSHHANAIIALRCCQLSRRGEEFWEKRAVG